MNNTKEKTSNGRITWIDMAKGYGMILVVIGHLKIPPPYDVIRPIVYSFHLPLFFFLSGYLFSIKESNTFFFIKKKIRGIIKPYFGLGSILISFTFILMYFSYRIDTFYDYIKVILDFLLQRRLWTLWFLTCLFFLNIIYYILIKVFRKREYVGAISLLLCVFGIVYYKSGGIALPWNVDVCFTALPFFFVGNLLRQNKSYIDSVFNYFILKKLVFLGVLVFVNLSFFFLNYKLSGYALEMARSQYGFFILTYVSAFAGIFYIVILSDIVTIKFVEYIGRNSIIYFALHQTVVSPIVYRLYGYMGIFQYGQDFLKCIISVILILIINTLMIIVINNTYLKKMLI